MKRVHGRRHEGATRRLDRPLRIPQMKRDYPHPDPKEVLEANALGPTFVTETKSDVVQRRCGEASNRSGNALRVPADEVQTKTRRSVPKHVHQSIVRMKTYLQIGFLLFFREAKQASRPR